MIVVAVRLARSEEGRKAMAQARRVATGPQARKLAGQALHTARQMGEAANTPQNRERVEAAARFLRERKRR